MATWMRQGPITENGTTAAAASTAMATWTPSTKHVCAWGLGSSSGCGMSQCLQGFGGGGGTAGMYYKGGSEGGGGFAWDPHPPRVPLWPPPKGGQTF